MKRITNDGQSGAAGAAGTARRANVVKAHPGQMNQPNPAAPRLRARDARENSPSVSEWICFGAGLATGTIYCLAPVLEGAGVAPASVNIALALSGSVSVVAFIASRTRGMDGQVAGAVRQ